MGLARGALLLPLVWEAGRGAREALPTAAPQPRHQHLGPALPSSLGSPAGDPREAQIQLQRGLWASWQLWGAQEGLSTPPEGGFQFRRPMGVCGAQMRGGHAHLSW